MEPAIIAQDPDDSKYIVVLGTNATVLQQQLQDLSKEYEGFTIIAQDTTDSLYIDFMTKLHVRMCTSEGLQRREWNNGPTTTMELLVLADDMKEDHATGISSVYVVVPAHLFMDENQRKDFANSNSMHSNRREIEKATTKQKYSVNIEEGRKILDLSHPPLFCFRHRCNAGQCHDRCRLREQCHHKYMNDVSLLHVKRDKADDIQRDLRKNQPAQAVPELLEVNSKLHLQLMCERRQKIVVGPAEGHLVNLLSSTSPYALHLPFVLTSEVEKGKTQYVFSVCTALF